MPAHLDKLHTHLNDVVLQTPFWKDVLSVEIAAKLQEYLGRAPGFTMRPQLQDVEEWLKSELMFRISPGAGLAAVDSKRLGDGWQSLVRLAALEVVMKLGDTNVMLLMEEPETFLHPHLRRRMRRVFADLQSKGSQVVATTHSIEMISFALNQNIVRVKMTPSGVTGRRYSTATASQSMKDEEKLHEHGNHEVVFANVAILTEGKDDEFAVRMGLEKCGVDCDAESVSVLACGGVGNLPDYGQLCSTLGIPWIAIHDADIDAATGAQQPKTAAAATLLATLAQANDGVLTWNDSLEGVLNCPHPKAAPAWTAATYGSKTWAELKASAGLANYCAVIEDVRMKAAP
jgi:hypothetical protein